MVQEFLGHKDISTTLGIYTGVTSAMMKETATGADIVIETSGVQQAVRQSIEMLKKCGKLCAIGMGAAEYANIPWNKAVRKSLDIICCMSSGYTAWDKALSLLKTDGEKFGRLVTWTGALKDWEEVFRSLVEERNLKAVFVL